MKSKKLLASLIVSSLLASSAVVVHAQAPKLEFPEASPKATVNQRVGVTDIEIVYARPSVKGRKVFGGLEPFGKVWRTGANSATQVTFSTPVKFNGAEVPAGTYGLFTIPGEKEWTIILNKGAKQWGAYQYKAEDDLVRVKAVPVSLPTLVETFTIDVNDIRDTSATLNLSWEKTRVPVKLEFDVVASLVPQIEAVMASSEEKKPYVPAAMFYYSNNLDLKKALAWMDAGIKAQPEAFYFVYRKALIQEKLGDKAGAVATAKSSLEAAKKAGGAVGDEYTRLNEELIARLK